MPLGNDVCSMRQCLMPLAFACNGSQTHILAPTTAHAVCEVEGVKDAEGTKRVMTVQLNINTAVCAG